MASFSYIGIECCCADRIYDEGFFSRKPEDFQKMIEKIKSLGSEKLCEKITIDHIVTTYTPHPQGFYDGHIRSEENASYTLSGPIPLGKYTEGLECFNLKDTSLEGFRKMGDCWKRVVGETVKN